MAKYTSELDTESEFSREDTVNKRKKKKNSRYISSEDDTSPPKKVVRRSPRFKLPTPPGNSQQASSLKSDTLALMVKRNLNLEKEVTNSDSSTPRTACEVKQTCFSCKDFTDIIRLLHIINGRVTQNAELITAILNYKNENIIQDNDPAKVIDIDIPAKTYIELMELDKKLSDQNIKEFMVTKLLHVEGTDIKNVIRRCMPQLVDDAILRQFSWVGGKGKKTFCILDMATLIKEVCKKNHLPNISQRSKWKKDLPFSWQKQLRGAIGDYENKENEQNDPEEELVQ